MTRTPSRLSYHSIGLMTYEVRLRSTGEVLGAVWRTRYGWSARRQGGSEFAVGEYTTVDYPGSREVAAATLTREVAR